MVRDRVFGLFIMIVHLIKGLGHSAGLIQSDFESEASRLGCLLVSFDGEPFVSSVCPPLVVSPFNQVAIIPMPETGAAFKYTRILANAYSFVTENVPFLLGLAAALIS